MLRILILCPRDWQHPRASGIERYTYEIFTRIAAQGHYVAWLCQSHGLFPSFTTKRPTLERAEGIQVARLGSRAIYRAMVGLFFSRLGKPGSDLRQFDVVVDVVNGRPFPVGKYTTTPAIPIVFHLSPGLRGSSDPPGPVVAPTDQSWMEIANVGIPKRHIIRAPFGVDDAEPKGEVRSGAPMVLATVERAQPFARALRLLQRSGHFPRTHVFSPKRIRAGKLDIHREAAPPLGIPTGILACAWFGYCGEGREWEALAMAARGLPVICPDTPAGREYVTDGKTGLLHRPRDASHLAHQMDRLLRDEVLSQRLALEGCKSAVARPWERSAGLVLAAIENLCPAAPEILAPV